MRANPSKTALVGAVVLGGWHLVWSVLVFLGWAQALIDFSMWAHMTRAAVVVGPFDVTAAATVITIATLIGYLVGSIVATVWNKVHRG